MISFVVSLTLALGGPAGLALLLGPLELAQQILEPVGNALAQHLVVDALKDIANSALILTAEASTRLSDLRVGMHGRL
jgi:hypothetical protein